jgi:hypothetical protein
MAIYAVATDRSRYYYTEKPGYGSPSDIDQEWGAFRISGLAPGDYFVLAIPREVVYWQPWQPALTVRAPGSVHFSAAYTRAVICGTSEACNDHTLVPVHVDPGATVTGIHPDDWYVPATMYPTVPGDLPWAIHDSAPQPLPATFRDPTAGAENFLRYEAALVRSSDECQPNLECGWITGETSGHAAAYVTAELGTNGLFRRCTFYAFDGRGGWESPGWNCKHVTSAFPAVGGSGKVAYNVRLEPGPICVNFHSQPSLTSSVNACLPIGTPVSIDGGPVYVSEPSGNPPDLTLNYWWHVANRGWVVHHYLLWSP